MSLIHSFFSAFLMYTRIPMPQVEWREENRRYSLCFFPLCGAVIGGLLLLWRWLCTRLGAGELLFASAGVALPVLVTGGIHLDGFCDVCDAKASCGDRASMLRIMSDPHIGSFAVIRVALYLLLQLGVLSEVDSMKKALSCALCFVASRALSALAAVTFRSARQEGTLMQFVTPAHRRITVAVGILYATAVAAGLLLTDWFTGVAALFGMAAAFVYYRIESYRRFGGITGDLAGYFLQLCELAGMGGVVAAGFVKGAFV